MTINDRQFEQLRDISRVPVRRLVCVSLTQLATLKALRSRELITLRYINSRAWDATVTERGQMFLNGQRI